MTVFILTQSNVLRGAKWANRSLEKCGYNLASRQKGRRVFFENGKGWPKFVEPGGRDGRKGSFVKRDVMNMGAEPMELSDAEEQAPPPTTEAKFVALYTQLTGATEGQALSVYMYCEISRGRDGWQLV